MLYPLCVPIYPVTRLRIVSRIGSISFDFSHFHHSAVFRIRGPRARLFAALEIAGAHLCSVKSKPFPITIRHAIRRGALRVNAAILMIFDALLLHTLFRLR